MDKVERWFEKAARRQERVVTLYPCLLRNRLASYFAYRLRFLFSLQIITFAVHVAEFLILLAYAPKLGLVLVVLLRAGTPLVRGAWWGAMEVMRERLRAMSGPGALPAREQEIAHWLFLSAVIATVVLLCGLGWLVWSSSTSTSIGTVLVDVYIVLIVFELAARIPVLTLHSGIYATRRIYRPFLSVLLPTIVQGVLMAALFGVLQEGALIVAIIASAACSLVISLIYIRRMYKIVGLRPTLHQGVSQFWHFMCGLPPIALMWSTTAGFLIRIDGLLVLVLIGLESISGNTIDLTAGHPEWNTPDLGILLYLILPAIRGSYEWSILFYFDFVRLRRAAVLRDLAHVFMAKLVFSAAAVGVFFWLLAAIVFLIGFSDIPVAFLFAMLPLFLVRAWLAVYQVRAFADGRFAVVCLSVGILLVGIALVGLHEFADIGSFIQIKICMLIALVFLIAAQLWHDRRSVLSTPLLSLNDWCRSLGQETGPVEAGLLKVAKSTRDGAKSSIRIALQDSLGDQGHCAWRDSHCLIYYQRIGVGSPSLLDPYDVLESAGGLITSVQCLPGRATNGPQALSTLRDQGLLSAPTEEPIDMETLIEKFRSRFSAGVALDLTTVKRAGIADKLENEAVASAIPLAMRALGAGALFVWCGSYRLYPAFLDRKLRALFFVPKDTETTSLSGWSNDLTEWTLSDASFVRAK